MQLISLSAMPPGSSWPGIAWNSALLSTAMLQKREAFKAEIDCLESQMHNRRIRLRGTEYEKKLGLVQ